MQVPLTPALFVQVLDEAGGGRVQHLKDISYEWMGGVEGRTWMFASPGQWPASA